MCCSVCSCLEIGTAGQHGIETRCCGKHEARLLHAYVVVLEGMKGITSWHHLEVALDGHRVVDALLAKEHSLPVRYGASK